MKKLICILSIICLALVVLSLVLTVGCVLLQKPLIDLIYGKSVGDAPMSVPVSPIVYGLCATVTLALLCLIGGNQKIGIWADVVLLGALILVLPGLNAVLSLAQGLAGTAIANAQGVGAIVSNAAVNQMCSFTMMPGGLGMRLALAVCGMSLVYKLLSKRQTCL